MIRQISFFILLAGLGLSACQTKRANNTTETSTANQDTAATKDNQTMAVAPAQLVIAGDFPDPSVTKIGDTYWATATSSEWAPLFPLMKSTDLTHWETVGHVFPGAIPAWAEANFWAPEISYENGKVYIYYTAKKKGGNLCVGVASADKPEGPYKDHGALVCQEVGSIDGFPIRDEKGQLYMVWKEDGNSRKLPTPIWAQRLNEERTALVGEKTELFRNDPKTWEGGLVEGPAIIRRGEYFYIFYAGDACCGRGCTYGAGVARAKNLLGPWEKYARNPIIVKNEAWKCPGHGTVIAGNEGKDYFLYHAYSTDDFVYTGRQGILSPMTWTADGWPQFNNAAPSATTPIDSLNLSEEFSASRLSTTWQWPVGKVPVYQVQSGKLNLTAKPDKIGAVLAQRTKEDNYAVTASINSATLGKGVQAGIAAIGDVDNALGISVSGKKVLFWTVKANQQQTVAESDFSGGNEVQLRLTAKDGHQFTGAWSTNGSTWTELKPEGGFADGSYLPPWDRGIRVGLVAKGSPANKISFDWMRLTNQAE